MNSHSFFFWRFDLTQACKIWHNAGHFYARTLHLLMKRFLIFFFTLFSSNQLSAENLDLFIMAGQSNMQGWRSDAAQYPKDPKGLDMQIPFFYKALHYGSTGNKWETLKPQPGHFRTGHFGPEVSFARAVLNAGYNPAIFKYSSGSSSLKTDWKGPGKKGLYDDMVKNIKTAIKELEAQGDTVTPRAIVWIQGESDADSDVLAKEYYWHLKKMLQHLRTNIIKNPTLPVILSLDEQHPRVQLRPQVVEAQKKLAAEDKTITFFSMRGLEKYDATHLTARGTILQGKRMFGAYKTL